MLSNEADRLASQGDADLANVLLKEHIDVMRRSWSTILRTPGRLHQARPFMRVRGVPIPLTASCERCGSCYAEREIAIDVRVDSGHVFKGRREDLDEMVGNLLDNACKWARTRVS